MYVIDLSSILFIARLTLGAVMLYYGLPKLRDLKGNAQDFDRMGFPPGWLWGTIVGINEGIGGILMLLGVGVPLVAASFGFQMILGTFWKYRIHKPFSDYSYDILALALAVLLMRFGGGVWSLIEIPMETLARWDITAGAIVVALIAATLSRPQMK